MKLISASAIATILFSPTIALATCAWVLWTREQTTMLRAGSSRPDDSNRWELQTATKQIEQCEQTKRKLWHALADEYKDLSQYKGLEKVDKVPYEGAFRVFKSSQELVYGCWNTTLMCLPDTIDPRK